VEMCRCDSGIDKRNVHVVDPSVFQRERTEKCINLDEAVAFGVAVRAAILSGKVLVTDAGFAVVGRHVTVHGLGYSRSSSDQADRTQCNYPHHEMGKRPSLQLTANQAF